MASIPAPLQGKTPEPLSFRTVHYRAGTVFPPRRQPWAELNYAVTGVAEITIEGVRFLSPPQYAIWIPPGCLHDAINRQDIHYVTVYIAPELCAGLPEEPCTLELTALLKAVLADLDRRGVEQPHTPEDLRLAMVIVDQIRAAPRFAQYLPGSDDPLLGPVLAALQQQPGDRRSLAEWARHAGTTERTLSRRCQDLLGLSFQDWRQRLRLLAALGMLEAGDSVRHVAETLGYNNPSAFIAMFKRMTGRSPAASLAASRSD